MRRSRQALDQKVMDAILDQASHGVLAVAGDYPYALPMSYAYQDGVIYFHCAKVGKKLDLLRANNKVSFCVVGIDEVLPEAFSTKYQSVIVYGQMEEVEDASEKEKALLLLANKYSAGIDPSGEIHSGMPYVRILKLVIDFMTGKQSRYCLD